MATRALDIILRGKDQASAVFGRVKGVAVGFGQALFSLKGLIASAMGGLTFRMAADKALRAWGEQARAEAKLAGVIRSTGGAAGFSAGQLKTLATQLEDITTFSDEAVVNCEALLATFTQIKGQTFEDAVRSILDISAVLDQDLAASAIQVGKALNDPVRGVTALRRVGVSFNNQQLQIIKQLAQTNQLEAAQRLILNELQVEFGGVAAEMARAAGSGQQLHNAAENVWAAFGKSLSPAMREFRGEIKAALPYVRRLADELGIALPVALFDVKFAFRELGPALAEELDYVFKRVIKPVITWFEKDFVAWFTQFAYSLKIRFQGFAASLAIILDNALRWDPVPVEKLKPAFDAIDAYVRKNLPKIKFPIMPLLGRLNLADLVNDLTIHFGRTTSGLWGRYFSQFRALMLKTLRSPDFKFPSIGMDNETKQIWHQITKNEAYAGRFLRFAPGQTVERGYTVKVATDPKTRELVDQMRRSNILLSRIAAATEGPTQIDMEVFEP